MPCTSSICDNRMHYAESIQTIKFCELSDEIRSCLGIAYTTLVYHALVPYVTIECTMQNGSKRLNFLSYRIKSGHVWDLPIPSQHTGWYSSSLLLIVYILLKSECGKFNYVSILMLIITFCNFTWSVSYIYSFNFILFLIRT